MTPTPPYHQDGPVVRDAGGDRVLICTCGAHHSASRVDDDATYRCPDCDRPGTSFEELTEYRLVIPPPSRNRMRGHRARRRLGRRLRLIRRVISQTPQEELLAYFT